MILINILLVLLIFLILSDLYIKKSPKSNLNLVPINYKIKKKDGLNELIIDLNDTEFSVESFNEYNSIISEKKDKNKN